MSAHARLSPSSATMWMNCPGAPNANDGLPDETSEFAAEGTRAHEISDWCLTFGLDPFDFVGQTAIVDGFQFEWTEDDAEYLLPGIDWIREQHGTFYGEHRVNLSRWLGDGQFGTLDRGIVSRDAIVLSDLKWGRGIPVSPVRNKQLMIYALGFYENVARHQTSATDFLIHIDQPRCAGGGGIWRTTLDELLAFGEEARAAAERTRDTNAPRIASADACLWCKRRQQPPSEPGALSGCKTYDEFNLALIGAEFEDLDGELTLDLELSAARRATLHRHRKMIEKWLEQNDDILLSDALAGRPAGGYKAVAGRRNPAKWRDKEAAQAAVVARLGDSSFTKRLITPTQCEKKVPPEDFKAVIQPLIQYGEAKPTLVPEEDERPALLTADSFDDLD